MNGRLVLGLFLLLLGQLALAQYDDVAYVPRDAPARTADDASIGFVDTMVHGVVELSLPVATSTVDLLNAQGNVVRELNEAGRNTLDLRTLRPGTWTLRAHTSEGIHVRRFMVLSRGGMRWVGKAATPVRRH